jgi:hypothetical protein
MSSQSMQRPHGETSNNRADLFDSFSDLPMATEENTESIRLWARAFVRILVSFNLNVEFDVALLIFYDCRCRFVISVKSHSPIPRLWT